MGAFCYNELMITVLGGIIFGLLGAVAGSFIGAQVWRLRAKQLIEDKAEKREYDAQELKRLEQLVVRKKGTHDRSRCLSCGHQLAWYDLLPVFSWLSVGGKCRYCKKPIGVTEILLESILAAIFAISYLVLFPVAVAFGWPGYVEFGLWLIAIVIMAGLFVYDMRWYLLPTKLTNLLIVMGVLYAAVSLYLLPSWGVVFSLLGAVFIMSGIYAILYYYSRWRYGEENTWIGFGDVHLGLGLALFLFDWRLAAAALFLANLLGTIIVIPGMLTKKLTRKSRVPFGPLLIISTVIVVLCANMLFTWFNGLFLYI